MSTGLEGRLAALAEAADLASGRLDAERVAAARGLVERAGRRLGLGLEATVVALAGPTGAGKSSLFNALAGSELAAAGARRPTTSAASAAVWGTAGDPLLDWLEVPRRHRMEEAGADGLVLLDLPDFDSVQAAHRAEFERLLELVDLVVWVVDPQKYADATLHDRYLRPLAGHGAAMVVVLNQADRLGPDALAACRADIGRLLADDGLPAVPVLTASATSGAGVPALRGLVEKRVAARTAALERLAADVSAAAAALGEGCGDGRAKARGIGRAEREQLTAALADAAGVPVIVGAVARAHRRGGALATGWPFVRWVRRARPDPLRRLHLSGGSREPDRTSLPPASPVQRAQVAAATRALAVAASDGLPAPWPALARRAATASEDAMADRLDRAVAGAEVSTRPPRWWRVAGGLQHLLALLVAAGAVWLLVLAGLGFLRLEDVVPLPEVRGFPLPTLLIVGGVLLGLLLAALTRVVNGRGARRRARRAERALRARVDEVGEALVVTPVQAELDARAALCTAVGTAAGRRA